MKTLNKALHLTAKSAVSLRYTLLSASSELGVIRRYRFYLSLVNIVYSQPLAGSPATSKVLPCYFNVFFHGAISRLAISVSAFRSLWLAVNQFAVAASLVFWPYINGQRCVTWS